MKIAQVVHSFYPTQGGIEYHAYYLSKELVKRGHEVTVFTSSVPGLPKEEVIDGIKVKRVWALGLFGFSSVKLSPMLISELTKGDFDIYHSHGYGSLHPVAAATAAKMHHKPFIFTLHGYQHFRGGFEGVAQSLYRNTAARMFLPAADKIISVTDATLNDISSEIDVDRVILIPNGVDTRFFKPMPELAQKIRRKYGATKGNLITYAGRLDKYKGIDVLIRAFKRIKQQLPDSVLLIAGKDEGIKKELEALANSIGVEDIFFEEVELSGMPAIYSASDVVVLPSLYEAQPLVMLEALSCGTPFVSNPVGEVPKVLSKAYGKAAKDFITKIEDVDDLAAKIVNVLKNKEKITPLMKRARGFVVKTYSWPAVCSQVLKVYRDALRERR